MNTPKGKYAWTVKVGEKGQFVIPKEAREVFHINPGDTLILLGDVKRGIAIPPKSTFAKYAANIFGGMNEDLGEDLDDDMGDALGDDQEDSPKGDTL
ncbi:MAG: AbrB/MazE/SpoVT family DNA-binding domain-containing protein [Clostridiales bacterium]|nr:AbrB/MazE/SpoVT family DNA-binding domain-containing protein [Clostridiales bacterium]